MKPIHHSLGLLLTLALLLEACKTRPHQEPSPLATPAQPEAPLPTDLTLNGTYKEQGTPNVGVLSILQSGHHLVAYYQGLNLSGVCSSRFAGALLPSPKTLGAEREFQLYKKQKPVDATLYLKSGVWHLTGPGVGCHSGWEEAQFQELNSKPEHCTVPPVGLTFTELDGTVRQFKAGQRLLAVTVSGNTTEEPSHYALAHPENEPHRLGTFPITDTDETRCLFDPEPQAESQPEPESEPEPEAPPIPDLKLNPNDISGSYYTRYGEFVAMQSGNTLLYCYNGTTENAASICVGCFVAKRTSSVPLEFKRIFTEEEMREDIFRTEDDNIILRENYLTGRYPTCGRWEGDKLRGYYSKPQRCRVQKGGIKIEALDSLETTYTLSKGELLDVLRFSADGNDLIIRRVSNPQQMGMIQIPDYTKSHPDIVCKK